MSKYLKVMFRNKGVNFEYKIDEVNIADNWNPIALEPKEMGGFNFSTEDKILRWLVRGDTIYDVIIPDDAEVVDCPSESAPHGVFRTNKIIITNPRVMTDDLAMYYYKISDLPEKSYYKSLAGCAIRGYINTCRQIIKDKVNKGNIDLVISELNDFIKPFNTNNILINNNEILAEIIKYLNEIKSDLLISRFINKEPYIKDLTNDKVINITGESGSGKSYFTNKYINDGNYIVIDTDLIFNNNSSDKKEIIELKKIFNDKPKDYIFTNFDDFYLQVLDFFKDCNKIVVIDSAQFRNIKDYSILKGQIIIMRTSVENCYNRVLKRWKKEKKNYTDEEYNKYADRKKGMFNWYNSLNDFVVEIDNYEQKALYKNSK